jgi:hypothetical protein
MARGKHRGFYSRALPVLAATVLALAGCDPNAPGVVGTVADRWFESNELGTKYYLLINTPAGEKTVREPFAPWSRCTRGEAYPSCKSSAAYRAEK